MTLFNGNAINWQAYERGANACRYYYRTGLHASNPHPFGTDEWHSWNKGWNSVTDEV